MLAGTSRLSSSTTLFTCACQRSTRLLLSMRAATKTPCSPSTKATLSAGVLAWRVTVAISPRRIIWPWLSILSGTWRMRVNESSSPETSTKARNSLLLISPAAILLSAPLRIWAMEAGVSCKWLILLPSSCTSISSVGAP